MRGQTMKQKYQIAKDDKKKSLIVSIIMLFSLPAGAEDNPADAVKACIGVARVLEMFAVDRRDADAADKYRNAKVYFIQKSGLTEPEVIKIIMATIGFVEN